MASIAMSTAAAGAASCSKNVTALLTPRYKARGVVRRSHLFYPLERGCGRYQVQRAISLNGDRVLSSSLRRGIGESTYLSSRGLGIEGGCQFGSARTGIAPHEAGRRLLLSSVVTHAGRGNSVPAVERILAAVGYILPFFDGIQYGRYFFMQFPIMENLLRPLFPLLSAYKGLPYSNFIAFFSLYLLVVRNSSFSRYVRFNAMQAVVLDVLLILPTLVERTFGPRGGIGLQLLIIFYNTVFLFLVCCFLFGTVSCLLGKTPRLPIVADAADAQVEG